MNHFTARCGCGAVASLPSIKTRAYSVRCSACVQRYSAVAAPVTDGEVASTTITRVLMLDRCADIVRVLCGTREFEVPGHFVRRIVRNDLDLAGCVLRYRVGGAVVEVLPPPVRSVASSTPKSASKWADIELPKQTMQLFPQADSDSVDAMRYAMPPGRVEHRREYICQPVDAPPLVPVRNVRAERKSSCDATYLSKIIYPGAM